MSNPSYQLLIVEDEITTATWLADYFEVAGYKVSLAENGDEMLSALERQSVDLVLLDINLPGRDGLSLAQEIRKTSDIGIILITSRTESIDRILGLEIGADDYVTKPIEPRELLARVKNLLRRSDTHKPPKHANSSLSRFSRWSIDFENRALFASDGERISLTHSEFDILALFVKNPGTLFSREDLANQIAQGTKKPTIGGRSPDVIIGRLRRKLELSGKDEVIETVHGVGYRFTSSVTRLH